MQSNAKQRTQSVSSAVHSGTMEELVFGDRGELLTHSPSTYKIPAIGDCPPEFRVTLLDKATNPSVVHGSKAVGEPPFNLAISAHAALARAVSAFGDGLDIVIENPATNEALLMGVERALAGPQDQLRAAGK